MKIPLSSSVDSAPAGRSGNRVAPGIPDPASAPSAVNLAARQNLDGGWPYASGISWTEPTVLATLAMLAANNLVSARKGMDWLRTVERAGGGWAPQHGVEESTWVTALVGLLPPERLGLDRHRRAVAWMMRLSGRESSLTHRLRQFMLGASTPPEQRHHGWPWFPGAAAWVGPSAVALLALRKEHRRRPAPELAARIEEGRLFLLSRMCRGGGWNHGSARALGRDGRPYPETTGMALAALGGLDSANLAGSLALAEKYLAAERSADSRHWLELGLLAHGRGVPAPPSAPAPCRTVRDQALALLTAEARQGRHWVLAG